MTERWLDEAEQQAWRRFIRVAMLLPGALDAELRRTAGLTHFAYFVLVMLSEAPGHALRMSELATQANASPSRLSHLIVRLEERGLIRRDRAEDDGRSNIATLTEAGFAAVVAAAPDHADTVRSLVFDRLSAEQVQALDEICAAILGQLDP